MDTEITKIKDRGDNGLFGVVTKITKGIPHILNFDKC